MDRLLRFHVEGSNIPREKMADWASRLNRLVGECVYATHCDRLLQMLKAIGNADAANQPEQIPQLQDQAMIALKACAESLNEYRVVPGYDLAKLDGVKAAAPQAAPVAPASTVAPVAPAANSVKSEAKSAEPEQPASV